MMADMSDGKNTSRLIKHKAHRGSESFVALQFTDSTVRQLRHWCSLLDHRHRVLHAEQFADSLFEFLDQRPIIRQPPPVEHVVDARQQRIPVTNVWAPNVKFVVHVSRLDPTEMPDLKSRCAWDKIHHGLAPSLGVVSEVNLVVFTDTKDEFRDPPKIGGPMINGDG
jgi:hypothetical protein